MKERTLISGFVLLCIILLAGIVVGYYGNLGVRTIIDVFFIPAFVVASALTFKTFQKSKKGLALKTDKKT